MHSNFAFEADAALGLAIDTPTAVQSRDPMLKHRPCAYCGTTSVPRGKGHVLPRSMYPDSLPQAKRITVPECAVCKAIWEDAEPHFKNILLAIWNPDSLPSDSRVRSMWRGFQERDGKRRARDVLSLMKSANVGTPARERIYPTQDPRFNLILRRIVRGLAAEHGLPSPLSDKSVDCDVMRWEVPPAFAAEFSWHTIAPDFFQYAYTAAPDESLHSFWLLRFSKNLLFFGAVARLPGEHE